MRAYIATLVLLLNWGAASATDHVVTANSDRTFSPANLTINVGDTVTFRNAGGLHNARADAPSVTVFRCANGCDGAGGNGSPDNNAWSATVLFNTPGTVQFYCEVHGAPGLGMAGTITVAPAPTSGPFPGNAPDLNADAHSDIVLRNAGQGLMAHWLMNGPAVLSQRTNAVGSIYHIAGNGDFDGDNRGDLLWTNETNDLLWIWRSVGDGSYQVQFLSGLAPGWTVAGVTDLNGDHHADIVFRNQSQGLMAHWWMNGTTRIAERVYGVASIYRIVGTGDFHSDGLGDLVWTNDSSDLLWLWRSVGDGTYQVQFVDGLPPGWTVAGVADLNGDRRSDLVLRNATLGLMAQWLMNGPVHFGERTQAVAPIYRIAGTGDYDADGRGDLLWTNEAGDLLWIWRSNGDGTYQVQFVNGLPPGWQVSYGN